jgi:hypothetical protein
MAATALQARLTADVRALIRAGDVSPEQLARRAPILVALLAGRSATAAIDAHAKLMAAVESLSEGARPIAQILLALDGKPPRTTQTSRRTRAGQRVGVSADHFRRYYEPDVIGALALALAARVDPSATVPSDPPTGPPLSDTAFQALYQRPTGWTTGAVRRVPPRRRAPIVIDAAGRGATMPPRRSPSSSELPDPLTRADGSVG